MIGLSGEPDRPGHHRLDPRARLKARPAQEQGLVVAQPIDGSELRPLSRILLLDPARITDLSASLGVKRRLAQLAQKQIVFELLDGCELGQNLELLVADELRGKASVERECGGAICFIAATGARARSLPCHERVEAVFVDGHVALARKLSRELERESVGVVKPEGVLAGDTAVAPDEYVLEEPHARAERAREALLFVGQDRTNLIAVLGKICVDGGHQIDHDASELRHEWRLESQSRAVLYRSAYDSTQHVAAPLVRRRDAVAGEDGHRTAMVGEHAMRLGCLARRAVGGSALGRHPADDRLEAVGVVDRADFLQDRGASLQPEAGVDVLRRQRGQRSILVQVELHEHEVPELEEPIAVAARPAGGLVAAKLDAQIEVHLGARPARPDGPGLPEVLAARQPSDSIGRNADLLPLLDRHLVLAEPQLGIAGEDRGPEALRRQLHVLGDELPRELDRALFEIVTEREVAEHLEERQMTGGQTDRVDVGGAEALLRRRQTIARGTLGAQEVGLQRLHPSRREQHGRIVRRRNERRRRLPQVAVTLEKREKALAQLIRRTHSAESTDSSSRWNQPSRCGAI